MNNKNQTSNQVNILLVDDNPNNLRLLSNILLEYGYQTRRVISGNMALQAARANNFDLILLDITMPEMDGYEVCRQLKADQKTENIPVVFISALNETLDKVKAFKVGAADYISKPFEFEEVIARVENQVQIISLQKKLRSLNLNLEEKVQERTQQLQIANQDLKKTQQKLLNKSLKDPVTNLDNKISFMGKFRQAIKLIQSKPNYCFTLLVFNCYCPQLIDEIHDLKLEDSITIALSQRLSTAIRDPQVMARLEGNEFAVIIDNLRSQAQSKAIAEKIKSQLTMPLSLGQHNFRVEAHYGLELGTKSSEQSEYILNSARSTARKAKYQSYCNFEIFQQNRQAINKYQKSSGDHGIKKNTLEEFEQAFVRQKIAILYQPTICLNNGQIKEVNLLLAWSEKKSEQKKIISFAELENIMQQNTELGILVLNWMIKKAYQDLKTWQEIIIWNENLNHIDDNIKICLKILDWQSSLSRFIKNISNITENFAIDRKIVAIEIPEALVKKDVILSQKTSSKLYDLGFNLSLENLSIKYISLKSDSVFPFRNLNITSSLMNKIKESALQKQTIDNTFNLARNLNVTITVNNVATAQELKFWRKLGCKFANGRLFSKPLSSKGIANLIQNNSHILNTINNI